MFPALLKADRHSSVGLSFRLAAFRFSFLEFDHSICLLEYA